MLQQRGIELVSRLNKAHRRADYRRGQRLDAFDRIVRWAKPTSIRSLDRKTYQALPESITVRETRVRVPQPRFRTRSIMVVTTLLEPRQATPEDLAALYRARWTIKTNLRHLKQTMTMDIILFAPVDGVQKELAVFALVYNLVGNGTV